MIAVEEIISLWLSPVNYEIEPEVLQEMCRRAGVAHCGLVMLTPGLTLCLLMALREQAESEA